MLQVQNYEPQTLVVKYCTDYSPWQAKEVLT